MCVTKAVNLPRHGRSTGTLQHQSSFRTHTGTWHICKECPSIPDETSEQKYKCINIINSQNVICCQT